MIKPKLKIIFTDGKNQKKIAWICNSATGWEVGFGYRKAVNQTKQDVHYTHHNDGVLNWHYYDDEKYAIGKSKPLENFVGIMHLFGANVLPFIDGETMWEDYTYRKDDVILYVDVREYVKADCRVAWSIYLLEPNRVDLISTINQGILNAKFHIFTGFNPWVLISLSKMKIN